MPRTVRVILPLAAYCLIAGLNAPVQAQTLAAIPDYFFKEWTVNKDCSEQHAGPAGHVEQGLKLSVSRSSAAQDTQSYALEVRGTTQLAASLSGQQTRLQYRAGSRMTTVPADFECIPGETATSPFLAMSGYSQSAEPWYEYEHWYGLIDIHGEPHHVLIFPRETQETTTAVIVLQDAGAGLDVKLDHNGVIHTGDG